MSKKPIKNQKQAQTDKVMKIRAMLMLVIQSNSKRQKNPTRKPATATLDQ